MVYLNMKVSGDQHIVLVPTIDTYVKYDQLEHFSGYKCQHFEQTTRTLWILMVLSNTLNDLLIVPCYQGQFLS